MSTFTPRLQLKRPDGSDPFLRQDFVDNFNKMDAAPGNHVCTSSSRPTWGAAQAGRTITESDTRTQWYWSGTAWLPLLSATSGWVLGSNPGATIGKGVATVYSLGTVVTTRPGTLLIDLTASLASANTLTQSASILPYVNGAAIGNSGVNGFVQWDGSGGSYNDYKMTNAKGYKAVAPGTYTIQGRVVCGTISTASLLIRSLSASIVLINETSR